MYKSKKNATVQKCDDDSHLFPRIPPQAAPIPIDEINITTVFREIFFLAFFPNLVERG